MRSDATLPDRVRDAIRTGKIPDRSPERTWGGRGCGASCAICDQLISADELEFELQFPKGSRGEPADYYVHQGCFLAWESELRNREHQQHADAQLSGAIGDTRLAADGRETQGDQGPL